MADVLVAPNEANPVNGAELRYTLQVVGGAKVNFDWTPNFSDDTDELRSALLDRVISVALAQLGLEITEPDIILQPGTASIGENPGGTGTIAIVLDGGGVAITTGVKGDLLIPVACVITKATLLADQSGSIVIDIWKDTYANYPPTNDDSITASAPPTISSATKSEDSTLTGWTLAVAAGSILRFNVDSCTTITRATLALTYTRT